MTKQNNSDTRVNSSCVVIGGRDCDSSKPQGISGKIFFANHTLNRLSHTIDHTDLWMRRKQNGMSLSMDKGKQVLPGNVLVIKIITSVNRGDRLHSGDPDLRVGYLGVFP